MAGTIGPNLPSNPFKTRDGLLRTLAGDVRPLAVRQTAMLIDVEFNMPMVLLITGEASGGVTPSWKLRTGLDRASLGDFDITATTFSRIALARSVQLSVTNNTGVPTTVKAVIVPIDATIDVTQVLGTDPVAPVGPPNVSQPLFIAANVASVPFTSSLTGIFAVGQYLGVSIRNESPANRNLYLFLNTGPAVIATHQYTQVVVPGGYYEAPFGYNGDICGIWDGADAAGGAVCTFFGFQS